MRAKDMLKDKGRDVVTIDHKASLAEAIEVLASKNIGAVVVTSPGKAVAGILSERDVVRVLSGAPTGFRESPVTDIMTREVFTAGLEASVDQLLDLMTDRRIRHVPIVDGDGLVGLLSIGDVVKCRIRQAVGEADALKEYISAAG
ncbi:hypothetical protein PB2503_12654 [Parvularcula bermudensis HTCC2503]|uniref:CBS domain-containing protein n=1 Tax=Parvularcula bermudensis (strain ATCC BAA-594 / HTCC2503 / KCTC 12087) TaxID=314260 RepID=E0TFK8_PARBH|nr:CBS domain-containing protein [Parvularcula bermudensis]ADM10568.1 hypothetical protein PB2503_12654 [Parvularcula bermudensis HTCC2503]